MSKRHNLSRSAWVLEGAARWPTGTFASNRLSYGRPWKHAGPPRATRRRWE